MNAQFYAFLFALLLSCLHGTCARAQEVVLRQGFEPEESLPLTWQSDPPGYGSGGLPTWNTVTSVRGISAAAEGQYFWAARDVENTTSGTTRGSLTFDAGSICALTSARFVFAYRVVGYDGGDDFGYVLELDGFAERTEVLVDGRNGGGVSTDGWVYDTVAIPGTAQTARLTLFFEQNGDDVAAVDDVQLLATGDDGSCRPVCGLRLGEPIVNCATLTDAADELYLRVPYTGAERGARVYASAGTVAGDDPGAVADGTIELSGLHEGTYAVLQVAGGDCDLTLPLSLTGDYCAPGPVVINEVLADPGEDINGDGAINGGDEFVEVYNAGDVAADLSGFRIHDGSASGARYTFPAGTALAAGGSFLVLASAGTTEPGCPYGVASGFLGLNNDTPESVTLRDPDGRVTAQVTFEDAPAGESLTLYPDGNLSGGYVAHRSVADGPSSACATNTVSLPVELRYFRATAINDAVRLDWATAREENSAYFVLERSKAGRRFDRIAEVPAGRSAYYYMDYAPFPGQNLYRLRQVDRDGREALYGPVAVRTDSGDVRVFPNPVAGRLSLSGRVRGDVPVSVYRPDGTLVRRFRGPSAAVDDLLPGLYFLRVSAASSPLSFIKE